MAFSDEITSAGPEIVVLCELSLPDGTVYFSTSPVEHGGHTYEPRITQIGSIQRQLSSLTTGLQISSIDMTVANEDAALNQQVIAKSVNRAFTVKLWANGTAQTFFSGLAKLRYLQGAVQISVVDKSDKYFGEANRWWTYLTAEDWPAMPKDNINKTAPLVIGAHDSRGSGYKGMLPTIELSPTLFLVAGHSCKAVGPVFVVGEEQLTGYSVHLDYAWTGAVNDKATVIEFSSAPDSAPTCDAQGLTDSRTSTGELLENPVAVLEVLREYVFGLADADVNSTDITSATTHCANYGLKASGYVSGETPAREIMGDILACFMLWGGWDSDGKWTIKYIDHPLTDGGGTAISERYDIVAGSLQSAAEENEACNHLTVNYLPSHSGGSFYGQIILEDSTSQTDMGRTYYRELRMPWCADPVAARTLGELALNHLKDGAGLAQWVEQLQHSASLDLGSQVAITDRYSPSASGGWSDDEFIITGMGVDLLQAGIMAIAMDVRPWTVSVLGSHSDLGDNLPWTVL